jgi:hypothetical protein
MRLLAVVQHLSLCRLEAIVEDDFRHRRRIDYNWFSKDASDTPPDTWYSIAVAGEVEFQRAEELAEAMGRKLPL